MAIPKFVTVVRSIIPKDGVAHNGHPNRVKSKVKKALDKANIPSETIRGVGRKIGDYAITYEEEGNLLHATFVDYATLNITISTKARKKRSKGKKVQLLTGPHSTVVNKTIEEYAKLITDELPIEWEYVEDESKHRWMAFDVQFMYNTGLTIEAAAQYIISMAKTINAIHYTVISLSDDILIGIGPA